MFTCVSRVIGVGAFLLLTAATAWAGGAWIPERGEGDLHLGYSLKTADSSWDPDGNTRVNSSWHIFRYVYTGGEIGVSNRLGFRYLLLYLDGLEGPRADLEHNAGFSEAFFGLKLRLREGSWPMALALNVRTSYLYDLPGTYNRHRFRPDTNDIDNDGDTVEAVFNGVSPEWRGLLGEDYGLSYLVSRSVSEGGWINLEVGYNRRTTNLADEIPLSFEIGYPLRWKGLAFKGSYRWVQSLHNHDEERAPEDRFGCSATNCFPDASMMAVGAGLFRDFGARRQWWGEVGFNHWIWGRSARKYEEPFIAVGRRF